MAQDIFAPKSSFDIAFERPQEPVQDNTAKVRSDFQAMALNSQARAIQGQAQVEGAVFSGINAGLSIAGDGIEAYQNAREKGAISDLLNAVDSTDQQAESGSSSMSYEERREQYGKAIQEASQKLPNGYADLAKYDSAIKAKTGLSLKEIATSPEQNMQEAMMKDPVFISAYQASRILEPNLTEQQRFSYAQNAAAENAAVSLMQTTANVNDISSYYGKTKPLITNQLKNLDNAVVASLAIKRDSGQPITTLDIEELEVRVAEAKRLIEMQIPNNVPQEERDNVTEYFTNLDNFLTQMKDTKDPAKVAEGVASFLAQSGNTMEEVIAGANITNSDVLSSTKGLEIFDSITTKLKDGGPTAAISSKGDLGAIFDGLLTKKPDEVVGPNTILSPEELGSLFDTTGMSADDLMKERGAGIALLNNLEVGAVATEQGRKQLVAGVASVVKSLNHLDLHQTGSQIKEIVEDSGLLEKINMLESVDKPAANQIRTLLNSALTNNLRFAESTLGSTESGAKGYAGYNPALKWDEATKTYYATDPQFIKVAQQNLGRDAPAVNSLGMPLAKGTYLGKFGDVAKAYKYRSVIEQTNTLLDRTLADGVVSDLDSLTINPAAVSNFDVIKDDKAFLEVVQSTSDELGIVADDLLNAMSFETVGTFSPSVKNPNGSATGLIQFLSKTAKGLGTTTAKLKTMSRVEQMEFVKKYLLPFKGRMNNLGDVYMAIHWPAGVGKGDDYVMYRSGSKEYAANRNLDKNKDGVVTRKDALVRLTDHMRANTGDTNITVTSLPDGVTQSARPPVRSTRNVETSPEVATTLTYAVDAPWFTEDKASIFEKSYKESGGKDNIKLSDLPYFATTEAADAAEAAGLLKKGDTIIVGTSVERVD